MSDALTDIETLALRCRGDRAREYVHEASMCYRAGAYRSAIVNSWIAVVFDLVDKVRELALSGDPKAIAINGRYETYLAQIEAKNEQGIKSALEFERVIVATCRDDLQFFTHQQIRDLDRLREDRHQCAHPSFQRAGEPYRPSAEQARLHLRNAVEHVLSQPPVQGRSAIAALVTDVASDYFPKDRTQAVRVLRASALSNASDALIRGFIDSAVFGYATSGDVLHEKTQVAVALDALLDLHRGHAEPRIADKLSKLVRDVEDAELPKVALLVASMEEGAALLNEAARIRLVEYLRTAPLTDIEKTFAALSRHAEFSVAVDQRVSTLTADELATVITNGGSTNAVKVRALHLLSEAGSFNTANFRLMNLLSPLLDQLERADVERIIRMPDETGADLIGATAYASFIAMVRNKALIPTAELDALLRAHRAAYLAAATEAEGT